MNVDQLLKTSTRYEIQQVPVDHRLTRTAWITMAALLVAAGIYHTLGRALQHAQVNFLFQPARQLTTFAGHPQTGAKISLVLIAAGFLLGLMTRGAKRANQTQHQVLTVHILASLLVAAPATLGLALYALASILWLALTVIAITAVILIIIALLAR